jgi:hypothetical protein
MTSITVIQGDIATVIGDITAIETDLSTNYYTKTVSDATFAPISHTHTTSQITDLSTYTGFDARYYTETEITASYYTKVSTDALLGNKSDDDHTHSTSDISDLVNYTGLDDRYYTESEVNSILTSYSLTTHTHSGYAPTSHTHSGYAPLSHTHSIYAPLDEPTFTDSITVEGSGEMELVIQADTDHQWRWRNAGNEILYLQNNDDDKYNTVVAYDQDGTDFYCDVALTGGGASNAKLFIQRYSTTVGGLIQFDTAGTYNWRLGQLSGETSFYLYHTSKGTFIEADYTYGHTSFMQSRVRIAPEISSSIEDESQLILYNVADETQACLVDDGIHIQFVIANRQHSSSYLTQWAFGCDDTNSSAGADLYVVCKIHTGSWNNKAYFRSDAWVGALDFTGQHRCKSDDIDTDDHIGLIVVTTGKILNLDGSTDPTINESLPEIELCNTYKDKRIYGVVSDKEDEGDRKYEVGVLVSIYTKEDGVDRIIINSVGEGAIWVNNTHGDIKNGDLICGDIGGYGTLQDDDIIHSYTVGKATMDAIYVDGKAFIGCVYYCG